ncbi:right-handed parallel beta-helix repeat-containing protein [Dyadobacter frigoris]|uniref:Right-handed parallel beta-helix repeat-containing protein n=1 Tax=Dyadobacter frigoris TaxID=2576211 RepID=A0A4U6CTC6_9BACT|nr:right-handed parallel beta-helix repeat-containing protein [Dyadobacter frigoris]TKT86935.1 right-handed parallel beta-helix repeat-containing protein [Dyadobacter frigoris]
MQRFCLLLYFFVLIFPANGQVHKIYVSVKGKDNNAGTFEKPFQTLKKALSARESFSGKQVSIQLRSGTYYLPETVVIKSNAKLPEALEIKAFAKEKVIISAGRRISPDWQLFKNGIYRTVVPPEISFERLYVDGVSQPMARYPNADSTAGIFNGTAEDATYYVRVLSWGNPFGGYLHALDEDRKGSLHYKITGVDDTDNVELDGGWQYNRPVHPDKYVRFVENIFGELDAPGEWYFDKTLHFLYFYPENKTDLSKAIIEVSNLKNSIELQGSAQNPIRNVVFRNLYFRHNERSFMESKEAVSGSDRAVFRGGALLLNGTENCRIESCSFGDLGGNAIMLSGYNKNDTIVNCLVDHVGTSAFSLLGNDKIKNDNSSQIAIINNTFHHTGEIEKQGSGIHLSKAKQIVIKNNKIYHVPGSAIKFDNVSQDEVMSSNNTIFGEFREINHQ